MKREDAGGRVEQEVEKKKRDCHNTKAEAYQALSKENMPYRAISSSQRRRGK
jgi:hypothetical protein